jgi:pyruvate,water dikinase
MICAEFPSQPEGGMEKTALGSFYGTDEFPIEWREGERELFWVLDDLHCPNPLSPMFFDIGGWWLTCDHMFRRFGTPFASDWIAKEINGYLYTAAIPADPSVRAESSEYNARYVPRVPDDEYGDGMVTPLTFSLPSASTAMAATSEESIPPDSPITTCLNPFLRT